MFILSSSQDMNKKVPDYYHFWAQAAKTFESGSYLLISRELLKINIQSYTFLNSALNSASNGIQYDLI